MKAASLWSILVLATISLARAQQPGPGDPIGEQLFPPELIMQNQKAIDLTDDQRTFVKGEIQKAQGKFTDLQWQLQSEVETMASLLKEDRVDEQKVLTQLDKVLNLERDIKRTQISLVVRIKNDLTPSQQAILRKIKEKMQQEAAGGPKPGRKEE